jgi:hypothetical protein
MRNALLLLGVPLWIGWGLVWLLPLKRKLLSLHGLDKTNTFFIDLAKHGDPLAKTLYWRTKVFVLVGCVGGIFMTLTKNS